MNISSINKRLKELQILIKHLQKSIKKDKLSLRDDDFVDFNEITISDLELGSIEPINLYNLKLDLKNLLPIIDQIPLSNGSKIFKNHNVNVGLISDDSFFNSIHGFCNLYKLNYYNYQNYQIDLLIVNLSDNNKLLLTQKQFEQTIEIMRYFRKNNIPVVFYSTSEKADIEKQISFSRNCDFVLCSSEQLFLKLKNLIESEVYLFQAAINPRLFNPIGMRKIPKSNKALFYSDTLSKFTRNRHLRMLFEGIYNNHYHVDTIETNGLDHVLSAKLYKLYNWFINLTDDANEFSSLGSRIFEAMASGNNIISNYSITLNNYFPNVFLVYNEDEISDILNRYSDEELYYYQVHGIRKIFSNYTSYDLFINILKLCGLSASNITRKVAIVLKDYSDSLLEQIYNQTYAHKEIVLKEKFNDYTLNKFDMIAFFDQKYFYDEFYLEDMINAFKYTNADYITKDAYFDNGSYVEGLEHDYTNNMPSKYRSIFWSECYKADQLLALEDNSYLTNGYSIDPFEINIIQRPKETLRITDQTEPVLSVIVPTYNNGELLYNKCFRSLLRSSIFDKMEIIIVDDGSTDNYTPKIINMLQRYYPNVVTFFYEDGGSGTASRPRNKGFELSRAPFITYLDPDNEAVNDGYAKLYYEIANNDYDIVIGNMMRLGEREIHLNYYKTFTKFNGGNDHANGNLTQYLINTKFKPMSIQALVVRRQIIEENKIKMPIGAAGQDSMFFHELMLNSQKVKVINQDIHVYYSSVQGSVVNSVSKNFYIKYLRMEQYRVNALKKYGLLNEYLDTRFEYYFVNWYLRKLKLVNKGDYVESLHILYRIYDLYKNFFKVKNHHLKLFIKLYNTQKYEEIIKHIP